MNATRPAYAGWLNDTNDVTRVFIEAGQIPDMINLAGGLPEPAVYPVDELAEYAARAMRDHPLDALNYCPIEGLPALRDAIAERYSCNGVKLSRDNVLITSGGMQSLDLVGKALLDENGLIAAQAPAYLGALDAWRPRQPRYRSMFPDQPGFDPLKSLENAQFAYTVPNFSNPTGKLIDLPTRRQLVSASHELGTWLIEDDPYGTLYYDSDPLPSQLALSAESMSGNYNGPVIYMGTLSKEAVPGLRIGWVIACASMIKTLTIVKQGTDISTSGLTQLITLQTLQSGLLKKILPNMLDTYRERRDALCLSMSEHLSEWFDWEKPVGGMFVWAVAHNPELDTLQLMKEALKANVCISPSVVFDPDGVYGQAMRLNFTRNPPEKLAEGVKRLAKATRSFSEGSEVYLRKSVAS